MKLCIKNVQKVKAGLKVYVRYNARVVTSMQRYAMLELAADWHELVLQQSSMSTLADNWIRGAAIRHTTRPSDCCPH